MSIDRSAVIAAHRFGLGAGASELASITNPKAWLTAQLSSRFVLPAPAGLPSPAEYLSSLPHHPKDLPLDQKKALVVRAYSIYLAECAYRLAAAIKSPDSFRERLVWFWSNHFTVSSTNNRAIPFLGAFEREAIRPNVTASFADLLKAAERHPAMLIYLDNVTNIGPDSRAGELVGRGINENLAREIMELHTLSVDGGYSQADVIAFAKILSGWSIVERGNNRGALGANGFAYYRFRHEPGEKVLLGKSFQSEDGEEEGMAALDMLAHHPATAHFIATKLARHFIADDPPAASVQRLEAAFRDSNGDLKVLYAALIDDPAAWSDDRPKARTPLEYIVAVARGAMPGIADELMRFADDALAGNVPIGELKGRKPGPGFGLIASARIMGQFPFSAPSPKGWPDGASSWLGADAVFERVEWSYQVGERIPLPSKVTPIDVAQQLFGPTLSATTQEAIARASSPAQGLALLFASPEFQRR